MRRFLWIGLGIWIVATLGIRWSGERWLRFDDPAKTGFLFALTAILIGVAVFRLARSLPTADAGLRAAVLIVLPGMLLDTATVLWFHRVFPKMPEASGMPFAALLLWVYGIALLAALVPRRGAAPPAGTPAR